MKHLTVVKRAVAVLAIAALILAAWYALLKGVFYFIDHRDQSATATDPKTAWPDLKWAAPEGVTNRYKHLVFHSPDSANVEDVILNCEKFVADRRADGWTSFEIVFEVGGKSTGRSCREFYEFLATGVPIEDPKLPEDK